jgi:hypothetical protein
MPRTFMEVGHFTLPFPRVQIVSRQTPLDNSARHMQHTLSLVEIDAGFLAILTW